MTPHKILTASLLAGVVMAALNGCGASDGPFDSREDAVEALAERLNSGDRDSVCALFADEDEDGPVAEGSDMWKDCEDDLADLPNDLELDPTGYRVVDDNERQFEVAWGQIEAEAVPVGDSGWLVGYVDLD